MNIKQILEKIITLLNQNNIEQATLKAKILLSNCLNISKEQLIVYDNKQVEENKLKEINSKIEQLIKGKPIQYITNKQEFMGMDFYVDENVLIPQPDTEILVENAIELLKNNYINSKNNVKVLDLCTGSGCIAISLLKLMQEQINNLKNNLCKSITVTSTDISDNALLVAKQNAKKNNIENNIKFINSNMFENIKDKFHLIVSNPPYIETQEIKFLSKEVQNEPKLALDGGIDGLKFYKIIAEESYKYLEENGYIIVEIGYNQKEDVINLFKKTKKYTNIKCKKDLANNDRIIIAKKV